MARAAMAKRQGEALYRSELVDSDLDGLESGAIEFTNSGSYPGTVQSVGAFTFRGVALFAKAQLAGGTFVPLPILQSQ